MKAAQIARIGSSNSFLVRPAEMGRAGRILPGDRGAPAGTEAWDEPRGAGNQRSRPGGAPASRANACGRRPSAPCPAGLGSPCTLAGINQSAGIDPTPRPAAARKDAAAAAAQPIGRFRIHLGNVVAAANRVTAGVQLRNGSSCPAAPQHHNAPNELENAFTAEPPLQRQKSVCF